jgi:transposase-like protein
MRCMYCGHFQTNKRGKTRRGTEEYQRYICKKCKKSFSELSGTIYQNRHLTPPDIELILKYKQQGMNITEVAKIVGVCHKTVANLIETHHKTVNRSIDRVNPIDSPPDTTSYDRD